jgi:DNA-binding XRE family transcriptional regulator
MVIDSHPPGTHRATLTDADRLLLVVRRMSAGELALIFRDGLSAQKLMSVITALPTDRLNELMDRARGLGLSEAPQHWPRSEDMSLATVIRQARKRAGLSQVELAQGLGIRQSSVSQWERGLTEPSTQNLLDLMRALPGLADALGVMAARRAEKHQPGAPAGGGPRG